MIRSRSTQRGRQRRRLDFLAAHCRQREEPGGEALNCVNNFILPCEHVIWGRRIVLMKHTSLSINESIRLVEVAMPCLLHIGQHRVVPDIHVYANSYSCTNNREFLQLTSMMAGDHNWSYTHNSCHHSGPGFQAQHNNC